MRVKTEWIDGADGRPECFSGEDHPVWAVYWPPPGQSSGPASLRKIAPRAFVGTSSAMNDVSLFHTWEEANAAVAKHGS